MNDNPFVTTSSTTTSSSAEHSQIVALYEGLTTAEAQERHQIYGPNIPKQLTELLNCPPPTFFQNLCCNGKRTAAARAVVIDTWKQEQALLPATVTCYRDKKWVSIERQYLVPGDVIKVKKDTYLPAHCMVPLPLAEYANLIFPSNPTAVPTYSHYLSDAQHIHFSQPIVESIPKPDEIYSTATIGNIALPACLQFEEVLLHGFSDREDAFEHILGKASIERIDNRLEEYEALPADKKEQFRDGKESMMKRRSELVEKLKNPPYENISAEIVLIVVSVGCPQRQIHLFLDKK